MLALAEYRARLCPSCGRDMDECTDPKGEGKWTVLAPTRCHASTALSAAQKRATEYPNPEALLWKVRRR